MASGEEFKPRYSLEHRDDGGRETVEVAVLLPGVQDGSSVECNVEPRLVKFRAPGRYRLSVPLSCDVDPEPLSLVFVRKKSLFKAKLLARPGAPFTLVTAIPAAQLAEAASALTAPLVPQPARSEFSGGSDEKRCASFKCKANCEASERAAGDGLRAAEAGDSMLAVKLLERACQLDPSNSAYATALRIDRAGVGSAARAASWMGRRSRLPAAPPAACCMRRLSAVVFAWATGGAVRGALAALVNLAVPFCQVLAALLPDPRPASSRCYSAFGW